MQYLTVTRASSAAVLVQLVRQQQRPGGWRQRPACRSCRPLPGRRLRQHWPTSAQLSGVCEMVHCVSVAQGSVPAKGIYMRRAPTRAGRQSAMSIAAVVAMSAHCSYQACMHNVRVTVNMMYAGQVCMLLSTAAVRSALLWKWNGPTYPSCARL
jgi:hypothetical protein